MECCAKLFRCTFARNSNITLEKNIGFVASSQRYTTHLYREKHNYTQIIADGKELYAICNVIPSYHKDLLLRVLRWVRVPSHIYNSIYALSFFYLT